MRLHRLRDEGLIAMATWLDELRRGATGSVPKALLEQSDLADLIESPAEVGQRRFGSRLQFASYIDDKMVDDTEHLLARDKGFWAWLSLFYFDEVCPRDRLGYRKPGHEARYIPDPTDYRTYYRHLLAGPWRVYRAHRDTPARTLAVLSGPLDKPGEVAEQLASRQELVSNSTVMEAVTALYFDRAAGVVRRGAAGRGRGSARRLAEVLLQFDLTYDLQTVGPDRLLALLPTEFDRFKSRAAS